MHEINISREAYNEWLRLLESGEVPQGTSVFYNTMTQCYCALGVLKLVVETEDFLKYVIMTFPDDLPTHIASMNDSGKTFGEIATYIRENVTPVG